MKKKDKRLEKAADKLADILIGHLAKLPAQERKRILTKMKERARYRNGG